ncbi:hypothetical protein N657DRAFT_66978 [Parathielavia appendiculata]|uniref:Uncharacterized protein n=1 Tax=Parathielavia appendiculata TaxID=2587402 RepID=A0AAN6Z992_9PEZI|nr:hypothetical protein N657DRAFT_66978 [Parathielavia appendiculata]
MPYAQLSWIEENGRVGTRTGRLAESGLGVEGISIYKAPPLYLKKTHVVCQLSRLSASSFGQSQAQALSYLGEKSTERRGNNCRRACQGRSSWTRLFPLHLGTLHNKGKKKRDEYHHDTGHRSCEEIDKRICSQSKGIPRSYSLPCESLTHERHQTTAR